MGWLSGAFLAMIAQKSAILPLPIQLSTSMVAKKRTQPQTQHTQHTTTKMGCRRPTLQRLQPSPSMSRPAAPPNHGAATPYGPMQGACHRVRRRRCWFPCFGHHNATHQITERGAGSWS